MRRAAGFTLLEVLIAMAILAISLTVLLQAQASSLANAGRSRDVTIATLLARSKLIDIEKKLFHEGFTLTTEDDDGNFRDEGHEEILWKYRVSEVQLDMSALASLCGSLAPKGDSKKGKKSQDSNDSGADCESMLGGLSGPLSAFTDELSRSIRLLDLLVTWPEGNFSHSMNVRSLLTRDDFQMQQETDLTKQQNDLSGAAKAAGIAPAGTVPTTSPTGVR